MTRGLPSLPPPVPSYRDRIAPNKKPAAEAAKCIDLSDYDPDPTGATPSDDAFLAAVADVVASPTLSGTICIGPGDYLLRTTVDTLECVSITFRSLRSRPLPFGGGGGTVIFSDDIDLTMFKIGGYDQECVTFEGLGFKMEDADFSVAAPGTGHVISSNDDEGLGGSPYILNCTFSGSLFGSGPLVNLGYDAGGNGILISGCFFRSAAAKDGALTIVDGGGAIAFYESYNDQHVKIVDNTFRSCWPAISSVQDGSLDQLLIRGNQFIQTGTVPIAQVDIRGQGQRTTISDNQFNGARAIRIVDPGTVARYVVSDNGGTVDIDASAIDIETDYSLVSDNVFQNRSQFPVATSDGIVVKGDHNRVTGNILKGFRYGVSVLSGATNTAVEGNTLTGTTGPLLDAGTSTTNVNNMA